MFLQQTFIFASWLLSVKNLPRAKWYRRPGFLQTPCFRRTVLVRLASIGVLMIKIYTKVDEACEDNPQTCCQQVKSVCCAFYHICVAVVFINSYKKLIIIWWEAKRANFELAFPAFPYWKVSLSLAHRFIPSI